MQGATPPVMAPKAGEEGQPLPEQPQMSGAMLAVPDMNAGKSREEVEAEELFGKDYDPPVPMVNERKQFVDSFTAYQQMGFGKVRPEVLEQIVERGIKVGYFYPGTTPEMLIESSKSPQMDTGDIVSLVNSLKNLTPESQESILSQLPEQVRSLVVEQQPTPNAILASRDRVDSMKMRELQFYYKSLQDQLAERNSYNLNATNDQESREIEDDLDYVEYRIKSRIRAGESVGADTGPTVKAVEAPQGELPPANPFFNPDGTLKVPAKYGPGGGVVSGSTRSVPPMTVKESSQQELAEQRLALSQSKAAKDDDGEKVDKYGRDKDAIATALSSTEQSQAGNLRFTTAAILHGPQRVRGVLGAKNDEQSKWWEGVVGGKSRRLTKAGRARIEEINRTEAEKHGQKYTPKQKPAPKKPVPQLSKTSVDNIAAWVKENPKKNLDDLKRELKEAGHNWNPESVKAAYKKAGGR